MIPKTMSMVKGRVVQIRYFAKGKHGMKIGNINDVIAKSIKFPRLLTTCEYFESKKYWVELKARKYS